jgi:hypothetical protein
MATYKMGSLPINGALGGTRTHRLLTLDQQGLPDFLHRRLFGILGGIRTHTILLLRETPHSNWATRTYILE